MQSEEPVRKAHKPRSVNLKIEVDPNCDCFYVYLDPYHNIDKNLISVSSTQAITLKNGKILTVDYDSEGAIIGLEFIG